MEYCIAVPFLSGTFLIRFKLFDELFFIFQLAQSRLEKRKERPAMELCRDTVMMALLREIHALKVTRMKKLLNI